MQTVPFGKLGLGSVYHAGGVSSVESIDPFRLASKQNKKGRSYGGFYVGPLSHAKTYPGEHVMKIDINPNARVLVNQAPGDTDRISVERLRSHLNDGVDMIWGKDIRGFDQGLILNKDIILNFRVDSSAS